LLLIGSIIQLSLISSQHFNLAPDEAYYWLWSKHLDFAYYSKGPLVAYLIWLGTLFFGDTELGVRLFAFISYFGSSLVLYFFVRATYGVRAAIWAWLIFRTIVVYSSFGIFITTDPPFIFFWLCAICLTVRAYKKNNPKLWPLIALCCGLSTLSKYTAVILFVAMYGVPFVMKAFRAQLKSIYYWLGAGVYLLSLVPVIYWNFKNSWVNYSHNLGHVVKEQASIKIKYFFLLISGQFGLVTPILFVGLVFLIIKAIKQLKKEDSELPIYLLSIIPLLVLCLWVSFTRSVYANWPAAAYLGGILVFGYFYAELSKIEKFNHWLVRGVTLGFILNVLSHLPLYGVSYGLPAKRLPTKKLMGWQELASKVDSVATSTLFDPSNSFIMLTSHYGHASEISFYSKSNLPVELENLEGGIKNQYDIWRDSKAHKGKDALVVFESNEPPTELISRFSSFQPLPAENSHTMKYLGYPLREFHFFIGKSYLGPETKKASTAPKA
jgi:4-amino-4-deoxy-L-arabinose transferase-like glycosyltransferase